MCRIKTTACHSSCATRSFDDLRRSLRLWSGRYGRSRANGLQVGLPPANELELTDVVARISLIAVGQTAGSLVWGALADWAVRKGLSAASVFAGSRRALHLHPGRRGRRNRIADIYRLGRVDGWRRSHAALRGAVDAFSPSLCGSSVRERRRIAVCCHPFHPVGHWFRRCDMAARGRSNVSDRLRNGIQGADRITTRGSGLVLVSSIGNTGRRAERRGNRCCVCVASIRVTALGQQSADFAASTRASAPRPASGAGPLGTTIDVR